MCCDLDRNFNAFLLSRMPCCLTQFSRIRPRHECDQEFTLDWIAKMHARSAAKEEGIDFSQFYAQIKEKIFGLGLGKERIEKRGTQLDELFQEDSSLGEIYPVSLHSKGTGFTGKSAFFDREATDFFTQLYPDATPLPPHLIHVTCTGYVAPSPAQKLVSLRNCGKTTTVTHAYHMGCYGAFPAIRMAAGFLFSSATADIVHTELCSLHMHPSRHSTEQLIVQGLFADGIIKYTAVPECKDPHFKVLALHEELIPNSAHCMTWSCGDYGLMMTLSKEVPVLIARSLEGYLERLCSLASIDKEKVLKEALFAVHPGGPKILQNVEQILKLAPEQIAHSKDVLRCFGNMSSATLPHIWENILSDPQIPMGTLVASFAFGPGLSFSGSLFQKGKG